MSGAMKSVGCSEDSHSCGASSSWSREPSPSWLLMSLSTVHFVLIKGGAIITLTLTAAYVTVVWSVIVGRQEGLLRAISKPDLTDCHEASG